MALEWLMDQRVVLKLQTRPHFVKIVGITAADKRFAKYTAPKKILKFQIPLAEVRIRSSCVENWRKNTTAENRWEMAWQVAWLIHWEIVGSSQNNTGEKKSIVSSSYMHRTMGEKIIRGIDIKMLLPDCSIDTLPKAQTHEVRFSCNLSVWDLAVLPIKVW